jgi:Domain of unknown function (DUF4398)
VAICLLASLVVVACGEPPSKEMHQAQGAIDAARAAGAAVYAPAELKAAEDALKQAEGAVAQRDYRQALNYALDSRERAQAAAKLAAGQMAAARSQAERLLSDVTTAMAALSAKLAAADQAKVPRTAQAGPRQTLAAAQQSVQEAGTALGAQNYLAARDILGRTASRLQSAISGVDAILSAQASRPGRTGTRNR